MSRTRAAWILAIVADTLQIVLLPAFGEGLASPAADFLDIVVAIGMTVLLGWHFAFLPTALAEIVPGLNLVPTWTAAVFFVTRSRRAGVKGQEGGRPEPHGTVPPAQQDARRKELPPGAR
ncbi:MAG TPA: hypothetical protein VL503_01815 [Candidatus Omnitrophota bacterium]|jgi:hypothetical protein|nr:hypothetical protein [Candidatus Omnitrophota bacterium]